MSGAPAPSSGWTEEEARDYLAGGAPGIPRADDEAAPAWRLGLTVVRLDRPGVQRVLDIASGPGGFLYAALEMFPNADGVWFDFSGAMREAAEENLAPFGNRVSWVLGDFAEVEAAGAPGSFDLVVTARASHHLLVPGLEALYRSAATLLAPGGWIANLDIMTPLEQWDRRLRAARDEIRAELGRPTRESHAHPNPMPSLESHIGALQAAGFIETQEIWRSSVSCMLLARRPEEGRG